MEQKEISQLLDRLWDYKCHKDLIELEKKQLIDSLIPEEVRDEIRAIEIEFASKAESIDTNIGEVEKQIGDAVKVHGETVKGANMMAVFNKPKVSWDHKALDAYAAIDPRVLAYRTVAFDPTVTIRKR